MGFEMLEADRTLERAGFAGVVYNVLTSLHYEADGCLDELRSRKAIGMLVLEAGVHIRFAGRHGCCSHCHMLEGRVVI